MKILVVNCGSSSIKYKLYEMENHSVIAAGGIEKVGIEGSFLKVTLPDGTKRVIEHECPTHSEGIRLMFKTLLDPEIGAIKSLDEISAAGHRIVAGGIFTKSQIVSDEMIEQWKPFMELAPLHSEAHLKGYLAVKEQLPDLPQVFVFDTAFHQTMPPKAYMYALPYRYYSEMRIRRYGAHGTSHRYVTQRAGEFLNMKPEDHRFITCHIGNGASISAVDHGKCVDTSMGLTPLEGLMMGTTEMSSDMRIIDDAAMAGNERAQLALDMYDYRIKKYIGAYAAAMNGVDAIIFTAGVGEHQWDVREEACKNMEYLGVKLDFEKNRKNFGEEEIISTPDSKVIVAVIPTDEELLIAKDTEELVAKC